MKAVTERTAKVYRPTYSNTNLYKTLNHTTKCILVVQLFIWCSFLVHSRSSIFVPGFSTSVISLVQEIHKLYVERLGLGISQPIDDGCREIQTRTPKLAVSIQQALYSQSHQKYNQSRPERERESPVLHFVSLL